MAKAFVSILACNAEVPWLALIKVCTGLGGTETWDSGVAARTRDGVNSAEVAIILEGGFGTDSSRIAEAG